MLRSLPVTICALLILACGAKEDPKPEPKPGQISGRVQVFGRTDLAGITLTVEGTAITGKTSAEGTFALAAVPPGPHEVVATLDGFVPEHRLVTVPDGGKVEVPRIMMRVAHLVLGSTSVLPVGFPPGSDAFVYLSEFDPVFGSGDLHVYQPGKGDRKLASGVGYQGLLTSADARLLAYGSDVAFLSGLGTLGVFDFATSEAHVVHTGVFLGLVGFDPKGKLLTFLLDYDGQQGAGTLTAWKRDDASLVTIAEGAAPQLTWSPDRGRLSFVRAFNPDTFEGDLTVWDAATGTSTLVAPAVSLNTVNYSADWSSVVFRRDVNDMRGTSRLLLRRLSDPDPIVLAETACSYARPTMDGKYFYFASDCVPDDNGNQWGTLQLVDFARRTVTSLGQKVAPDQVVFDQEETRFAYLAGVAPETSTTGHLGVYTLETAKGLQDLVPDAWGVNFTPDGTRLLFRSAVNPETQRGRLHSFDYRTDVLKELAQEVNRGTITVSPDGERVLYVAGMDENTYGGASMWLQPIAGGPAKKLGQDTAMAAVFSPAGNRVAYLVDYDPPAGVGKMAVYDVNADEMVTIGDSVNITAVNFSADGQRFAFLDDFVLDGCRGTLKAWHAGDPAAATLATDVPCMDYRFTPGADAILYTTGEALELRYFDEAAARALGDGMRFMSVADDAKHGLLLYDTSFLTEPVVTLSAWDLAARARLVIGERVGVPTRRLMPDGNRLVFLSSYDGTADTGDLVVYDLDVKSSRTLGSKVFWAGTAFSPDQGRVAFLSDYDRVSKLGTLVTALVPGKADPLVLDAFVGIPLVVGPDAIAYVTKPPEGPENWLAGLYVAAIAKP